MARLTDELSERELENPTFGTPVRLVWHTLRRFLRERPGWVIISAFLLIMLWGYHGELELLHRIWPDYKGPGMGWSDPMRKLPPTRPSLINGIPWDNELISFWGGVLLVVLIPMLIIRFRFRQSFSDYGLGLPPKGRRSLALIGFLLLVGLSIGPFFLGVLDPIMRNGEVVQNSMQYVYPFYRPFTDAGQFILYELTYLPFFIAIEFIFRGYLLFGLAGVRDTEVGGLGVAGPLYFQRYGLLIQMLAYTAWHLGKPIPELWGTAFWGLAAGAIAYTSRSIWPVMAAHFLLNVFLDYMILQQLGIWRP